MTAIMGSSGAGKTTLLNFLSSRASSSNLYYEGDLLLNDNKVSSISKVKNLIGFVPQSDVVVDSFSVEQIFRMYGTYRKKKNLEAKVDEVLEKLGLEHCRENIAGSAFERGLSGGEKKRMSIGVELMSDPDILFLDEPTTGLDATTALDVIKVLKKLNVDSGMSIVAVLHQPRPEILELFDQVMILSEGHIVFDDHPRQISKRISKLGQPLLSFKNPAETIMEIIDTDHIKLNMSRHFELDENEAKFFSSIILKNRITLLNKLETKQNLSKRSLMRMATIENLEKIKRRRTKSFERGKQEELTQNTSIIESLITDDESDSEFSDLKKIYQRARTNNQKRNGLVQFFILWYYSTLVLLRDGSRLFVIFVQQAMGIILIALVMRHLGDPEDDTIAAIQNRIGYMFMMMSYSFFFGLYSDLVTVIEQRALFVRDKNSRCYDTLPYFLARQVYIMPLFLVINMAVAYIYHQVFQLSLDPNEFVNLVIFFYFNFVGGFMCGASIGCIVGNVTDIYQNTGPFLTIISLPFALVSGFYTSVTSSTAFIRYYSYLSPHKFIFQGLALNEFRNRALYMDSCFSYLPCPDDPSKKCRTKLPPSMQDRCDPLKVTDFQQNSIFYNMMAVLILCVFFRIVGYIIFRIRSGSQRFVYKKNSKISRQFSLANISQNRA